MGLNWLALGDSITFGQGASVRSKGYIYQTRKLLQANGKNHFLVNAGISGIRADELLSKYKGFGGRGDPDLITLMIGTNDLGQNIDINTYKNNLGLIIDDVKNRKSFGKCEIVLLTPPYRNDTKTSSQAIWNQAVVDISVSKNVKYINTYSAFSDASYLSDTVHPNDSGHSLLSTTLFNGLNVLDVWNNTPKR
jgi:lysophospholipase L1-like esterase